MTKTFTEKGIEYLLVEVPEDAYNFIIIGSQLLYMTSVSPGYGKVIVGDDIGVFFLLKDIYRRAGERDNRY